MYTVVGVRFKSAGKVYYFDPKGLAIEKGDFVIVETARGLEYGEVVLGIRQVGEKEVFLPLKPVTRIAEEQDRLKNADNKLKEKEAFDTCVQKIEQHGLKMKLVDVEFTFDNNKLIFYFTADGRIDFRELVKDLAAVFRTRIELRQIGVRDEAKMIGGMGPCGRPMCCSNHLGDFEPVSIKMAKEQGLSLNPTKISGICGRLMCCLKYEQDTYVELKRNMPYIGDEAITKDGKRGEVVGISILRQLVKVKYENDKDVDVIEYKISELKIKRKQNSIPPKLEIEDYIDEDEVIDVSKLED